MTGRYFVERDTELRKFALASDEPFARCRTLAFSGPEDAYRRSADFFLSQVIIPLSLYSQLSKWRASGKSSERDLSGRTASRICINQGAHSQMEAGSD